MTQVTDWHRAWTWERLPLTGSWQECVQPVPVWTEDAATPDACRHSTCLHTACSFMHKLRHFCMHIFDLALSYICNSIKHSWQVSALQQISKRLLCCGNCRESSLRMRSLLGSVYPVIWLGVLWVINLLRRVDRGCEVLKQTTSLLLFPINQDLVTAEATGGQRNCDLAEHSMIKVASNLSTCSPGRVRWTVHNQISRPTGSATHGVLTCCQSQ
jgi:hypothetical protein